MTRCTRRIRHSSIRRLARRAIQLGLVALTILVAAPALAQDGDAETGDEASDAEPGFVEPTAEQKKLNDQAVQALTEENYAKAVSYLQEAIFLGELNVSYLNLGRAYQKMGSCRKAKRALGKVAQAPKVAKPPPEFVRKKTAEYMAELPEECPTPEEAEAEDASGDEAQASGPAKWPIGVIAGGAFVMAGGGLALIGATTIRSSAEANAAGAPENGYTQREFVEAEREANTLGAAGLGAAAVGAIATGVGIYLLVSDKEQPAAAASVSVSPTRDGASALFRLRF